MWKIGNVEIQNQVVLAPMAGICNSAYRHIIKEMGCGLIYAEMVSDKAIMYDNEKTLDMLYMSDFERPISQQIFGSDMESFVIAAKKVYETMHPDIIDINMGCLVPKVAIRSQAGSALLKNPSKVREIIESVVKSVPIPVTVKIRSGWDANSINAIEIAKIAEEAGASAIAIHPRTRSQQYSGKADWNIIKQVKESVKIPVIGNGDIRSCYDAKRMLEQTGCDAVMIGRAALGNPWLIKECVDYLEKGIQPNKVTDLEKIDMMLKHFEYLLKIKPEGIAVKEIRSHVAWYLKGIKNSVSVKTQIFKCTTKEQVQDILLNFRKELYEDK